MFGKLLKYEFKSIGKWYFALNAGIIAIAAVLSFSWKQIELTASSGSNYLWIRQLIPLTLGLTLGALIAGSLLATLIIIINRFQKNIFGREGYLTLTLPVSEHNILTSKLVASFVCCIFNAIVLIFAAVIIFLPQITMDQFMDGFKNFIQVLSENWLEFLYIFFYFILSTLSGILLIYLSISIGQLFANHRGLKAFFAYAIISIVLSIAIFYFNMLVLDINQGTILNDDRSTLITLAEGTLETLIFYFATHFIMKYKLNLQ